MPLPQNFGRYEVRRELGRGGMGVVYAAWDPRFRREVAVKVLSRELLANEESRARFDREARAAAGLEHATIVPVHDYGEEDGEPYIVFRLMGGGSLADRIRQGPLALAEVIALVRRVGSALDHAHANGVVHRDVKPGNVLFDNQGAAWLGDFGIARVAGHTSSLTGLGVIGSPQYMSPEQAEGRPATAASDVYSLGATVYEALAGVPPFTAEHPVAVLYKLTHEDPPPLLSLRPELPPAVAAAVARCMARDPANRYATAPAFAAALAAGAESAAVRPPAATRVTPVPPHEPVATPPPPPLPVHVSGSSPAAAEDATPARSPGTPPPGQRAPGRRLVYTVVALVGAALIAVVTFGLLMRGEGDDDEPTDAALGGATAASGAQTPAGGHAGATPRSSPAAGATAGTGTPPKQTIVLVFNPSVQPLTDARVREALASATPSYSILWFDGRGIPLGAQVSRFDPVRAKQLLDAAGVAPPALRLALLTDADKGYGDALARLIAEWHEHLGVEMSVEAVPASSLIQRIAAMRYQIRVESVQ